MTALPNDTAISRLASPGTFAERIQADILDLKAEIEAAIVARDEDAAAEAHRELIDLEHELRVRETVRRCAAKQERAE